MYPVSPLLPDPELEEVGDRFVRALERYAKRLRPAEFLSLIDAPTEAVFRSIRLSLACDSVGLWIADEAGENLVFAITDPEDERIIGREQPLSEGFISLVFASEQPICENRVAEDERHSKRIDSAVGEKTEAMVAVPFYLGGRLGGVLSAVRWEGGRSSGDPFGQEDLRSMRRASVVLERLANLALAKAVLGVEL
ncbi:MAG: GAF domain-containing protein [Verrucomicrobiales bacterium]